MVLHAGLKGSFYFQAGAGKIRQGSATMELP
jgi:hypothetical protein